MPPEPSSKRAIAFIDGQNLFYAAKYAFDYSFPNYDPSLLADAVCRSAGWTLSRVHFYTGVPSAQDDPSWNHFWSAKLAVMGTRGVVTFSRNLKYRNQTVALPDGTTTTVLVGQEKGVDVRLAIAADLKELGMAGEWIVRPLEDCLTTLIDYRGKTPQKTSSGIPLITAKVVKGGRIETPDEFIAVDDYEPWMRRGIPKAGDVVITTEAPLGEVAQLGPERVALAQRLIALRGKPGILDNGFLKFLMQSGDVQDQLRARASGTTVLGIKQSELRKVLLKLPGIDEQRAIAHILGTLDDKIELNRRMNETLVAMARALFKSWFVAFDPVRAKVDGRDPGLPQPLAGLFPDCFEDSELGQIPKGWRTDSVGDHMLNFDSKRVPVSGGERAKRQGQYPYHGAAGIMDHVDDYLFDGIYLLLGEDGSVVQSNGMAVTQYAWGKLWVNNHAHVLQGKRAVSTEQLYCTLTSSRLYRMSRGLFNQNCRKAD